MNVSYDMLKSRKEYNRYYGDFRGVDFSSDHTQVLEQRLAYSVNMFKAYQSNNVGGIETVPGFRRRVVLPSNEEVYSIHSFKLADSTDVRILIHAGKKLYLWKNYPNTINITQVKTFTLPESDGDIEGVPLYKINLDFSPVASSVLVYSFDGQRLESSYEEETRTLTIASSNIVAGDVINVTYSEGVINEEDIIFSDMNERKSESFVFNNRLYIIDGKNYLRYDGISITNAIENAYVPTTFKNIIPSGENADTGLEYEERNILQPKFKHTFYADGQNKTFYLNEKDLDSIDEVKVYDTVLTLGVDYEVDSPNGKVTMTNAPAKPTEEGYPENFAGIEITASKAYDTSVITKCTIAAIFDERVFLSGNPDYQNNIYFCGRNNVTGFTDPTYFPATNYVRDGVGNSGITGLIPVADTLMALKEDTQQDGSVYFHSEHSTGVDLHPKDYPSARGLSGIGCVGACINFLDDPVFVSKRGLEGISKLQIASERSIQHRSTLVDAKLVNLGVEALKNAKLDEWNGYLILLVDGKIFMADSRQMYSNDMGVAQYEWYYLEDIGVYINSWNEYAYSDSMPSYLIGVKSPEGYEFAISDYPREVINADTNKDDEGGELIRRCIIDDTIVTYTINNNKAFLCYETGAKTGGDFNKAVSLKVIDGNILFGTSNGVICSFNFDKRDEMGEIASEYYNFDGRTIFCGAATKMDCCGIPHLTKNTVKKSTVIKTKSAPSSTIRVKVRTNLKPYQQVARINTNRFDFNSMDFADFSFNVESDTIFAVKEKEKQWVEKQYYLYSDEYCKPFSIYYIAYRYNVAGRIK